MKLQENRLNTFYYTIFCNLFLILQKIVPIIILVQLPCEEEWLLDDLIAELYEELRGYLLTLIRNRLFEGCPDDYAYDCLNDVFEIALKKQSEPSFQKNPRGWLIITAKHVVENFNRKTLNRLTFHQIDYDPDWQPGKVDMLENLTYKIAIEKNIMEQIKSGLSPEDGRLFELRYMKKMHPRDIAEELHITENSINVKLTRMKVRAKRVLHRCVS